MQVHLADKKDEKPKAGPVPKEALEFFRRKKLKPALRFTQVWREEHNLAFTVAKLMEVTVLEHVRKHVEKAIAEGTTLEDFKKDVGPQLEESGWRASMTEAQVPHRLRVIYETNMRMARANGQEDRAQRTKKVMPFFIFELGPSKEHNPEHVKWAGTILSVDDPWWAAGHAPPCTYGCKCRRRQISKGEANDKGGESDAPVVPKVEWELPDVGRVSVPAGVHPSFAYPKGSGGREKVLGQALDAAKAGEDGPKPVDPEKTSVKARNHPAAPDNSPPAEIATSLSDGARRVLAEIVSLCPNNIDTTGPTKLGCHPDTARKHIKALTSHGLVATRTSQERLNLYVTDSGRRVNALLQGTP